MELCPIELQRVKNVQPFYLSMYLRGFSAAGEVHMMDSN